MIRKNSRPQTPEVCPVCGEDVPPRALACPDCGADHRSGWKVGAYNNDALDLPDDEFNYDEFVKNEFGGSAGDKIKPAGLKPLWWITGLVVLILFVWMAMAGR